MATGDDEHGDDEQPRTWMTAGLPTMAECERHEPGDRYDRLNTCAGCVAEYLDAKFGPPQERQRQAHYRPQTGPGCDGPADEPAADTAEARRRHAAAAALDMTHRIG